jgi:hypothetical protein
MNTEKRLAAYVAHARRAHAERRLDRYVAAK